MSQRPATLADLQKAIQEISNEAITYFTTHKAEIVTFASNIEYSGYDAATLIGILKEKGGAALAGDMTRIITMRYVRGTGFVKDVNKKVKVAAGSTEAAALVSKYRLVTSVGDDATAITPGRIAQLFPDISHTVARGIPNVKMAVDSSDLSLPNCDNLLWDYVPQYIKLDSETAPYMTTKTLGQVLFAVHVVHSFLVTKKTMPEQKKKARSLTKDHDMLKYTTSLLVITCKSKNLADARKEAGRKNVLDGFTDGNKLKSVMFTALASMSHNYLSTLGSASRLFMAEQSTLLKVMVDNCSKSVTEIDADITNFFSEE
ncbi:coat protein [wheat yellows virus]|nr:coat protein [wheat yellows virus]WBU98205.1 coat protein [wheat yellows virus]WBU98212.1 coat protein [wheat yellows virus]WBU98219.1 coat protein [wheat yellows virus]WBU98226.1 coat protein [wheat yellows virus]